MNSNRTALLTGESAGARAQGGTSLPYRILVVEDDQDLCQLNTKALARSGYEVDIAVDGVAAWRALNTASYDLMITDNQMPKVSGIELLEKLRSAGMELPVIMATGASPNEMFARNPQLRPAAILLKPYTGEMMLRTVERILSKAHRSADASPPLISRKERKKGISPFGHPADAPLRFPALSRHRILVVDEDSDLRLLYADALARSGYLVHGAEDGAAGWAALQANEYHLLITEHDVPKLTGVELVRKLRAAHMALPVVMASGRLPTHDLARDASLQLAATLRKPFAVDALLETVRAVLHAPDNSREQIEPLPNWQSLQFVGLGL